MLGVVGLFGVSSSPRGDEVVEEVGTSMAMSSMEEDSEEDSETEELSLSSPLESESPSESSLDVSSVRLRAIAAAAPPPRTMPFICSKKLSVSKPCQRQKKSNSFELLLWGLLRGCSCTTYVTAKSAKGFVYNKGRGKGCELRHTATGRVSRHYPPSY